MKLLLKAGLTACLFVFSLGQAAADLYESNQVIQSQQFAFEKSQILSYVDSAEVQQQLIELGISSADAKNRIANMTHEELASLNQQINEGVAGGIVGTIVTVLVVIAVLDVLGITDVYPFIRPIT
ncbi:hypothetical protein tinsulaeT_23880 [Thalassotalea insulae]|uniref:PA2779 family protein n=1 Tax=Thalassotalea insulae TaxID=2056778 RepID=A0ABQ6GSZ7_9GAMM|nr:PA2779 family protein [Thalassotalea insulae]GLX79048.1 hypothetical protein tinsulaeT_23880 [Thalassotalea insulae]